MSNEEILRKERKPPFFEAKFIHEILNKYWDIEINTNNIKQLGSYDDGNYYIENVITNSKYILKIYNGAENSHTLQGFAYLFSWLQSRKLEYKFPVMIPTVNNSNIEFISSLDSNEYVYGIRLFEWIEGDILQNINNNYLTFYQVGIMLGQFTLHMQGFQHDSFQRVHAWDLKQFHHVIVPFIDAVDEQNIQTLIKHVHTTVETIVLPASKEFRWGVIQGDCNDANIIINSESIKVIGLIDFGDSVYTWVVNDIATCMCYALLSNYGKKEPYKILHALFMSYISIFPLLDVEILHLKTLIAMRLSLSTAIGAYSIQQNPLDEYLKIHAVPAKFALEFVCGLPERFFFEEIYQYSE